MAGKGAQGQLVEVNPEKVRAIIHSLRELYDMGKPETNEELRERIDMFFEFCEESSIRPGVQALCTAFSVVEWRRLQRGKAADNKHGKKFHRFFLRTGDAIRASIAASRYLFAKKLVFV